MTAASEGAAPEGTAPAEPREPLEEPRRPGRFGWAPEDSFAPEVLLSGFAAFGIGQVIERNAQLARAREQLVDLAVTRERERMGRDVHDILGHSLTVIAVKTELAGRLLESVPAD